MRRGVNVRDTSERRAVCSGGSMKIMDPVLATWSPIISSTVPWLEMNVPGSFDAASTSAYRLSAQKSWTSLR